MYTSSNNYYSYFGISNDLINQALSIEKSLSKIYSELDKIKEIDNINLNLEPQDKDFLRICYGQTKSR